MEEDYSDLLLETKTAMNVSAGEIDDLRRRLVDSTVQQITLRARGGAERRRGLRRVARDVTSPRHLGVYTWAQEVALQPQALPDRSACPW